MVVAKFGVIHPFPLILFPACNLVLFFLLPSLQKRLSSVWQDRRPKVQFSFPEVRLDDVLLPRKLGPAVSCQRPSLLKDLSKHVLRFDCPLHYLFKTSAEKNSYFFFRKLSVSPKNELGEYCLQH